MTPETFLKYLALLLAGSLAMESGVLAGMLVLPDGAYHGLHLALMVALLIITLALYRGRRRDHAADSPVVLMFAAGLAFTLVGDYVNSRLSQVEPVTLKLTWALLFFGLGYSCYIIGMWKGLALLPVCPRLSGLIPVILAVNVIGWFTSVAGRVAGNAALSYGSFVFNATLYVLLPWLSFRFLVARRYGLGAVAVVIGAVLLPYSDLVLFTTWLVQPPDAPISTVLYASNWIVYFGGQCLINVFTAALALAVRDRAPGPPAAPREVRRP